MEWACPHPWTLPLVAAGEGGGAWAELRTLLGRAREQLTEHTVLASRSRAQRLRILGFRGTCDIHSLTSRGQGKLVFLALGTHEESEVGPVPSIPSVLTHPTLNVCPGTHQECPWPQGVHSLVGKGQLPK